MATAALRDLAARGATLLLRVNAEPSLLENDLGAIPPGTAVAVMLPKVESAAQVEALATLLAARGQEAAIAALIDTPSGVLEAARIPAASPRLRARSASAPRITRPRSGWTRRRPRSACRRRWSASRRMHMA